MDEFEIKSKEFEYLRDEIRYLTKRQYHCLQIPIVISIPLVGYIVKVGGEAQVLLVAITWLFTIYGFIWIDIALGIERIGVYIQKNFEDPINAHFGKQVVNWENDGYEDRKKRRIIDIHKVIPFFYYFVPSGIALYMFYKTQMNALFSPFPQSLIFYITCLLIILTAFQWLRKYKEIRSRKTERTESGT